MLGGIRCAGLKNQGWYVLYDLGPNFGASLAFESTIFVLESGLGVSIASARQVWASQTHSIRPRGDAWFAHSRCVGRFDDLLGSNEEYTTQKCNRTLVHATLVQGPHNALAYTSS